MFAEWWLSSRLRLQMVQDSHGRARRGGEGCSSYAGCCCSENSGCRPKAAGAEEAQSCKGPLQGRASRTYLALAVKRSSLAAYFGLRPGDLLEEVAGGDASELDPRALRSALAAERVELAFARRSLEDAEEVASIRIQATWSGEVSAAIGPSREKRKEKATAAQVIPGTRLQANWPSEVQQLRFYEFPPHHHLLSRVFMIYKVMSPQPICFGDLLLRVEDREASDLDSSTLSHMRFCFDSILHFLPLAPDREEIAAIRLPGSEADREEIAAIRIQSAFRARRGRKDRSWVRWLLEGLRPLYVLPGLAHLQQRLQGKPMAPSDRAAGLRNRLPRLKYLLCHGVCANQLPSTMTP
ncbi:hypothetical protein AK812_SmicGene31881 [Symbiodinium microadriaticum]|uniref:PDZ domain-containing protein n=1 Tax=Symbiodinium microadriaticum TaxID=2951 RepID=A0A1Q9CVK0_SYMMI|nr:hypothetical protein AK812_SmicGene31881 [Symbiodinium microadriaticum]